MDKMQAVIIDPNEPGHVAVREVEAPRPAANEALVRGVTTSLTPVEVYYSQSKDPMRPIGCDVAGVVEQPAADGSGPKAGARVIGRLRTGAWAELIAAPTDALAEIPDNVSFEEAATLPTSGLTALYALEKGERLLARNVLITAANGSVGLFTCQIAKLMGTHVVGQIRHERNGQLVAQAGADEVVVSADASETGKFGPYKLIAEAVGGVVLANCMTQLAADGICVIYGNLSRSNSTFEALSFFRQPRVKLYGFIISNEFGLEPASSGLARLAQLVSQGKLKTRVTVEESLQHVDQLIQDLEANKIDGKAVIHLT